jgi:hypothetical protein
MKEIKDKSCVNDEICQTGACGCSVRYILLGIVVIILIISAAVIFGN